MLRDGQRSPLEGGGWVVLKVNARARRISVRIDARTGEAVAVAPRAARLPEALAFARLRAGWIAERLAARPVSAAIQPGGVLTLEGRPIRLAHVEGAAAAQLVTHADGDGGVLVAGGTGDAYARRVVDFLKRRARVRLNQRTDVHLKTLGLAPVRVSIVDTVSRWGSCSPHNRSIRYSWRVIMAPPQIADYLAAHEVAHLVHADHSAAYWRVVRDLIGDPAPHRAWLRANGATLQAFGR